MSSLSYVEYEGKRYQTYLSDDFEVRTIGSPVPWKPDFHTPGEHCDGFYRAEPEQEETTPVWIVVKDCKIHAVVYGDAPRGADYGIQEPPRELWPEIAWEAKEWRAAEYKRKYGDPETDAINAFTRAKMAEPSFMRMLMGPHKDRKDLKQYLDESAIVKAVDDLPSQHEDMYHAVVSYLCRRQLTEAGKWVEDGRYPLIVCAERTEHGHLIEIKQVA
jgi:hypothetical protein